MKSEVELFWILLLKCISQVIHHRDQRSALDSRYRWHLAAAHWTAPEEKQQEHKATAVPVKRHTQVLILRKGKVIEAPEMSQHSSRLERVASPVWIHEQSCSAWRQVKLLPPGLGWAEVYCSVVGTALSSCQPHSSSARTAQPCPV